MKRTRYNCVLSRLTIRPDKPHSFPLNAENLTTFMSVTVYRKTMVPGLCFPVNNLPSESVRKEIAVWRMKRAEQPGEGENERNDLLASLAILIFSNFPLESLFAG